MVASASLSAVTAWGIYRRRLWAWWTAFGLSAAGSVYGVLAYSRIDADALYRAQGFDPERMHVPGMPDVFGSPVMWIWMLGWSVLYLGFLLWARRYFAVAVEGRSPVTPAA